MNTSCLITMKRSVSAFVKPAFTVVFSLLSIYAIAQISHSSNGRTVPHHVYISGADIGSAQNSTQVTQDAQAPHPSVLKVDKKTNPKHGTSNVGQSGTTGQPTQDPVLNVMRFLKVDMAAAKSVAPHLPDYNDFNTEKQYTELFKAWVIEHHEEFVDFANHPSVRVKNYAWVSIGLPSPYKNKEYLSPYSQASAVLSHSELLRLAPNFPQEQHSGNVGRDRIIYDKRVQNWQKLYPKEHESWLNAPEIRSIKNPQFRNPVTLGIQDPLPAFFHYADIDRTRPTLVHSDNPFEDQENLEMRLQHWYFVYFPEKYRERYGELPLLPAGFDVVQYRKDYANTIVQDDNKRIEGEPTKPCKDSTHDH